MVTSAFAGLSPRMFITQSYSGKMVVTICKFLLSAAGALFVLQAVMQPAVNESAVNTDNSFFKIYTSGLKEAERHSSGLESVFEK